MKKISLLVLPFLLGMVDSQGSAPGVAPIPAPGANSIPPISTPPSATGSQQKSGAVAPSQAPTPAQTNRRDSSGKSEASFEGSSFFVSVRGHEGKPLTKFDISKLNDEQKEVDSFIRDKTKVGEATLKSASGDQNVFEYVYENKTKDSSKTWIITVERNKKLDKGTNTSAPGSTDKKFIITGINFIENGNFSEQDKEKFAKQMSKFQESMKQFDKKMKEAQKELEETLNISQKEFDSWF